jgi:hypothetical protein
MTLNREALKIVLIALGATLVICGVVTGVVLGMVALLGEGLGGPVAGAVSFVLAGVAMYLVLAKWGAL